MDKAALLGELFAARATGLRSGAQSLRSRNCGSVTPLSQEPPTVAYMDNATKSPIPPLVSLGGLLLTMVFAVTMLFLTVGNIHH